MEYVKTELCVHIRRAEQEFSCSFDINSSGTLVIAENTFLLRYNTIENLPSLEKE